MQSSPLNVTLTPSTLNTNNHTELSVSSNIRQIGVFELAPLRQGNTIWKTYSGVDYYQSGGNLVRDVSTRMARSDNDDMSFFMIKTIVAEQPATPFKF